MDFFQQFIPKFLLNKRNQTIMVTFVSFFALVFIVVYKPFDSANWGDVSEFMYFVFSLIIVLLGVIIVAISRVIMYQYTKKHEITYVHYGTWVFIELLLMAVSYTICSVVVGVQSDTWLAFKSALINTSLILLLPYTISIIYFSLQDKKQKLQQMENDFDNAVSKKTVAKGLISFYDERGELQLSVTKENLLYVESADNYVCIWYMKNNLPKKLLLRNTLKRTAEQLENTNVMRCHRSFMVNMEQVKVLRREKENFFLELGINGVMDIPVSKTYGETVMKWLSI